MDSPATIIVLFSRFAQPQNRLKAKDSQQHFVWDSTAQNTFNKLKSAIITAPVLVMPYFQQTSDVECDASGCGCGVGSVLMQ